MSPGPALGLDYGTVRIGVAVSDPERRTAVPVTVLSAGDDFWTLLAEIVADKQPTLIVVGLPVGLSGAEGSSALGARALAEEAAERFGIAVTLADERFTTSSAEQVLRASNVRSRRQRAVVDAMAATIMLQDYLDAQMP